MDLRAYPHQGTHPYQCRKDYQTRTQTQLKTESYKHRDVKKESPKYVKFVVNFLSNLKEISTL